MFDLTQKDLDQLSYAQLCEVVLKQQKMLKQCNDTLEQALDTLNKIKEMAK